MKKKTRFVILGLLREQPMTGYELKKWIDLKMSLFWRESFGQLYPELGKMVQEGLIQVKEENETGGRGKTRYVITENGRVAFNGWMSEICEKDTIRSEARLKFFLADEENEENLIQLLKDFHQQNSERLAMLESVRQRMAAYQSEPQNKYVKHMLDLGIRQQQLCCDWSRDYIRELEGDEAGAKKVVR